MADGDEQLLVELRMLGRSAMPAAADPERMAAAVVAALPTPRESRLTGRRLALVAVALLVALLAVPPVRAAVAEWLGFGGVRVELGDPGAGNAPPPPAAIGRSDLEEAAGRVTFAVLTPRRLGPPTGVEVAPDGRMVSMTWVVDGSVVRLDQFDGTLDFAMAKRSPGVQYAAVRPVDALWFEEPHEVVLLEPDGSRRAETARLAGHTLIWPRGRTTLRLEGDLALAEAVAIAESAAPVG
jgi:hypothetical protein